MNFSKKKENNLNSKKGMNFVKKKELVKEMKARGTE